jgi:histidinol dehydrogenase
MNDMIPILRTTDPADRARIDAMLHKLRLDPADLAAGGGPYQKEIDSVQQILSDVARRGDQALVDVAVKFDDPKFTAAQIRVSPEEMKQAAGRVPPAQMEALRRSIGNVRAYQSHIMPTPPAPLKREGVELGLRFTPLDSVGLYMPAGKAAYPSTLVMLAVPAQVAGVSKIVVCFPPSKYGKNDLILGACHELGLADVFRAGGAAAIAAMAFGTKTIPAVDKIVGPGNRHSQLAKRALAGAVGVDGFLGPSEILVIADGTGSPKYIASDLMAQAEHDPGSCFLLTSSEQLAADVVKEIEAQLRRLGRAEAIKRALAAESAIIIGPDMDTLIGLADRFAAEHVNIQTKDNDAVLAKLKHAGAVFVGPFSPVAAGDYAAGPSHCLPTNTTARFSSGISVYEFLKRSSVVRYEPGGLAREAQTIITLAEAEGLDAHANSVRTRETD